MTDKPLFSQSFLFDEGVKHERNRILKLIDEKMQGLHSESYRQALQELKEELEK